jgi:hypothetical protein
VLAAVGDGWIADIFEEVEIVGISVKKEDMRYPVTCTFQDLKLRIQEEQTMILQEMLQSLLTSLVPYVEHIA